MTTIRVDVDELPESAKAIVRRARFYDDATDSVEMKARPADGGNLIYFNGNPELYEAGFPVIVLAGKKAYEINPAFYSYGVDGSALAIYSEIVKKARAFRERDADTCKAVNAVHDFFVTQLKVMGYAGYGTSPEQKSRHGRIVKGELTAIKIWNEGKRTGEQPEPKAVPKYHWVKNYPTAEALRKELEEKDEIGF